jgi:putative acetyltransferase
MSQTAEAIDIRCERSGDAGAIDDVLRAAFERENEAVLVRAVRASAGFIPALSLVAEIPERVVGHILLSAIEIEREAGAGSTSSRSVPSLGLAPLAIHPKWQNRGIGSALVREGLSTAARLGHTSVIVLGHPGFYRRFGFRPAAHRNICPPFDAPSEAFLVLELVPDALASVRGTVRYPAVFEGC